jgi:hypothetical protein
MLSFVKNIKSPICVNCINFIKPSTILNDNDLEYGKCKLFGIKDVVSGKIKYEYASVSRISNCNDGKYFTEK